MDVDTVSRNYYNYVLSRVNKAALKKEDENNLEGLFSGAGYYTTWDNINFYNSKDLLATDTTIDICLFDSLHPNYTHPCPGIITSPFGWRDGAKHGGIDLDLNKGDKVFVAFDGIVRMAIKHSGYGNVVVVRHYNGLESVYAHLSKIKVKVGQQIYAGDVVGLGGSTGRSTGSHVHFELRFKGLAINPANLICFKEQKISCGNIITIRNNKWGTFAYPKDSKFYTIQKGDTLFTIAKKYGLTTAHLRQLNGISSKSYLKVGYRLRIA
jgi:murein DD-endopeptidase MepM/ murein hydrolase activator NlpD